MAKKTPVPEAGNMRPGNIIHNVYRDPGADCLYRPGLGLPDNLINLTLNSSYFTQEKNPCQVRFITAYLCPHIYQHHITLTQPSFGNAGVGKTGIHAAGNNYLKRAGLCPALADKTFQFAGNLRFSQPGPEITFNKPESRDRDIHCRADFFKLIPAFNLP